MKEVSEIQREAGIGLRAFLFVLIHAKRIVGSE